MAVVLTRGIGEAILKMYDALVDKNGEYNPRLLARNDEPTQSSSRVSSTTMCGKVCMMRRGQVQFNRGGS